MTLTVLSQNLMVIDIGGVADTTSERFWQSIALKEVQW
jgi:hypothetical protein